MKKVFISGNFNVIHHGHLRLLMQARELGEYLIVGVRSDRLAGIEAVIPDKLRLEGIKSLSPVTESLIFDEPIKDVILKYRPDIVLKGLEHKNGFNEELEALESYGGRLVFSSGESLYSSLDLIQKKLVKGQHGSIKFPGNYARANNFDSDVLKKLVRKFSKLKVVVIGDLIVDEYIFCDALGMSQEDPTIVVTPVHNEKYVGGAGVVALHAKKLGAEVLYIGFSGEDEAEDFARKKFSEAKIQPYLIHEKGRPTTIKKRYRAKDKTLLRVSILHQASICDEKQMELMDKFIKISDGCNLLVLSDFNYGVLPTKLVEMLINYCKDRNILIAADSQSSSQMGDISRFKGADLITPTEHEARISLRNTDDGLAVIIKNLMEISSAKNIILKMGSDGALVDSMSSRNSTIQKIEALNDSPVDVAGAGDSLLIAASLALAAGASVYEAACLGSFAAALQVSTIGNSPINESQLMQAIDSQEAK